MSSGHILCTFINAARCPSNQNVLSLKLTALMAQLHYLSLLMPRSVLNALKCSFTLSFLSFTPQHFTALSMYTKCIVTQTINTTFCHKSSKTFSRKKAQSAQSVINLNSFTGVQLLAMCQNAKTA